MSNKEKRLTSLKAVKECIDAAIKNIKLGNDEADNIAIDNAQSSLKSALK